LTYIGGVRLRAAMLAGAIAGLSAGLVFAIAHAILIVPIWDRMTGGLVFGVLAGAGAAWAFTELYPDAQATLRASAYAGARFGGMLWLAAAPATVVDAALRTTGITQSVKWLDVPVALIMFVTAGALLGRTRRASRRAMLAGAVATLLLGFAMSGPVPIMRSPRAFGIFLAVLPAALVAGGIVGMAVGLARRTEHRAEVVDPA
jgi:uncharacterized membrane protein (UPF0136 family)